MPGEVSLRVTRVSTYHGCPLRGMDARATGLRVPWEAHSGFPTPPRVTLQAVACLSPGRETLRNSPPNSFSYLNDSLIESLQKKCG
jgi:hypothetical protein